MAWDDVKREKAVNLYLTEEPTPETSVEILKTVADELGETPNGVRMVLIAANVYVKKDSTNSKSTKTTSTKISKNDSLEGLKQLVLSTGNEVDNDIIDKLSGKQAIWFTNLIKTILNSTDYGE